jgi:hypothetical protein
MFWRIGMTVHPESLLAQLQTVPDPRRREGRKYPLPALLGMLLLGVLHGRDSLRGAWRWASYRWPQLWRPLGARSPHFPCYQTMRSLVSTLDADAVDRGLRPWVEQLLGHPVGGISADGKRLRGSKRAEVPGRHLLSVVSHDLGGVLAQREAVGGNEVDALLAVLTEVPLRERLLTLDAGLLHAEVTQTIQAQDGDYLGLVKGNHAEVKTVLDDWVHTEVFSPGGASGGDPLERCGPLREATA